MVAVMDVEQIKMVEENDIRTVMMNKLRLIPCIGCIMALLSGISFATASFTVELCEGVDAAFIVTTR